MTSIYKHGIEGSLSLNSCNIVLDSPDDEAYGLWNSWTFDKMGELPVRVGWGKKLVKRVGRFDNSYEGLIFLLDQFTLIFQVHLPIEKYIFFLDNHKV